MLIAVNGYLVPDWLITAVLVMALLVTLGVATILRKLRRRRK